MASFGAFFCKPYLLCCIRLLTTEIQWIFSGEEDGLKSCIGEGHPSPFVSHLCMFWAHKGSIYAWLFLAPYQMFLVLFRSHVISVFGRISGPLHA